MQRNVNIPDSTITTNLSFKQLVLMNMQQLTNFPYIEKDFDALTDYELLCLVVKFLNDVIANQNEQNTSITSMYNAFLELQTYVNNTKDELEDAFNNLDDYVRNYFDNLDVQEEINNKLNQMLEDGVLEQIIEQFVQSSSLWCFDNVADMKLATNLIDGSYVRTIGYYAVNDGGGATYKVRTKTEQDVIDNGSIIELYDSLLIAELIIENNRVSVKQFDVKGNGITNDTLNFQKAMDFACEKEIELFVNNGTYLVDCLSYSNYLKLKGESKENTILVYNKLSQANVQLYETCILSNIKTIFDKTKYVEIKDLTFDGNKENITGITKENNALCGTIYLANSKDILIDNCIFKNSYRDQLRLSGGFDNAIIKNSSFINCGYTDVVSSNNAISITSAIYNPTLDETRNFINKNAIIDNCYFDTISDEAIAIWNLTDTTITNSRFNKIGDYLIEYHPDDKNSLIINPDTKFKLTVENNYIDSVAFHLINQSAYSNNFEIYFNNNTVYKSFTYDPYNRKNLNKVYLLYFEDMPNNNAKINLQFSNNYVETTGDGCLAFLNSALSNYSFINNKINIANSNNNSYSALVITNGKCSFINNEIKTSLSSNIPRMFILKKDAIFKENYFEGCAANTYIFAGSSINTLDFVGNYIKNTAQYGPVLNLNQSATIENFKFIDNNVENARGILEGSSTAITNAIITNNISTIAIERTAITITNKIEENNIAPTT